LVVRSSDNGLSWGADQPVSDVISPQPEQPDPTVQSCYAGDYNYHSAISSNSWVTWTDGRVQVSRHNQQDVFLPPCPRFRPAEQLKGRSPIARARVQAMGPVTRASSTRVDGTYHIEGLPEGSYDMTVTAFGYSPGSATGVAVIDGQTTIQSFMLTASPAHMVSGTVTNSGTGLPIAGATVTIQGTPIPPATTDANGMYQFPIVPEGTYTMTATKPGFLPGSRMVTVDMDIVVDFALDPAAACDRVPGNLVVNCGFETGDFTGWTRSGDPTYTNIDTPSAHSATYGLDIGPVNDLGFIAQNLATTSGATYSLCYWLLNLGGSAGVGFVPQDTECIFFGNSFNGFDCQRTQDIFGARVPAGLDLAIACGDVSPLPNGNYSAMATRNNCFQDVGVCQNFILTDITP
jgi:hypothetical protein